MADTTTPSLGERYEAMLAEGDAEGALAALSEAVERLPEDVAARVVYGLALEAAGDLDAAAYQLLQADKRAPDRGEVLRALGTVFYKKGLYDKAVRFLGRATKVDPGDARSVYALGVVHDARRDPGAAIAAYRSAIAVDPTFIDARRTLIDTLAQLGEHAQAIAAIDDLLEVHPRDEQAANNREVLREALEHLMQHRLLGKLEIDLERSALIQEGQLKRKGRMPDGAVRYAGKLVEIYVTYDAVSEKPPVKSLMMVFPDPKRASTARDHAYGVTVVGKDGRRAPTDFATAASLTFLREALGVPMTQAGVFYQRLVSGEPRIEFGGARVRFASRAHASEDGQEQPGLLCEGEPGILQPSTPHAPASTAP